MAAPPSGAEGAARRAELRIGKDPVSKPHSTAGHCDCSFGEELNILTTHQNADSLETLLPFFF